MSKLCLKKSKTFSAPLGEDVAETVLQVKLLRVDRQIVTPNDKENKKNRMKQKTQIQIEFSETIAYSRRSERFETFCPQCKSLVEMSTPQVAAILTQLTEREIYRLVETGKVHFVETDRVLVCLKSLTAILSKPPAESGE